MKKAQKAAEQREEQGPPQDDVQVAGRLVLELRGPDGKLKQKQEVENLVTTVGKNLIADQLLASPSLAKPSHMAVGTGATAPALGDTALQAEVASSRVALTSKTRSGNVVTYVGDFPAGTGTGALTEAGLFNAGTGGDMPNRVTFSVVNKAAGDSLKITWTTTVG